MGTPEKAIRQDTSVMKRQPAQSQAELRIRPISPEMLARLTKRGGADTIEDIDDYLCRFDSRRIQCAQIKEKLKNDSVSRLQIEEMKREEARARARSIEDEQKKQLEEEFFKRRNTAEKYRTQRETNYKERVQEINEKC